jgi:hypothetical protein
MFFSQQHRLEYYLYDNSGNQSYTNKPQIFKQIRIHKNHLNKNRPPFWAVYFAGLFIIA